MSSRKEEKLKEFLIATRRKVAPGVTIERDEGG